MARRAYRGRSSPMSRSPVLLLPLLLLLLSAASPVASAGLYPSDTAEGIARYRPLLDRLASDRDSDPYSEPGVPHSPLSHEEGDEDGALELRALDAAREDRYRVDDEDRYRSEDEDRYGAEDEDWIQIGEPDSDSSGGGRYQPIWVETAPREDDWNAVRPALEDDWPAGPLSDEGPDDDDWVQIGSPEDRNWAEPLQADTWEDSWLGRRAEELEGEPLGSMGRGPADWEGPYHDHEQDQDEEQGHGQDQDQDQERDPELEKQARQQQDLAAELTRSRPDSAASAAAASAGGDAAFQLDQIRHALQQEEDVFPPHSAALRASAPDQHLSMVKRLAAGAGGAAAGHAGRHQYMPWFLIAGIAVGTVAAVLGAIFVARRVRGAPSKVVSQQWIPHHVLRMSTGGADVQPACSGPARAADQTAEPIRIKAKGLLERRCSSSSLTIQLGQTEDDGEPIVVTSPATHSEAAEYLASAGNRLSRRELRQTEENVAALQAEFWDIPLNFPDKCDVVGANTKNRYKTVIPNEHTRVILPGVNEDPLSSYINANWIRGYDNEERAYIATQGPLAHTLEDFWQLVLSRRAPAVVMITKLRENGRIKCAGYLPETRQKATFGKIEVTVKRILPRNGYTLRQVTVKRGKEQLQLQHFWFTAWPDHRTPDDSQQLLQMAAEVESARRDSEGIPTGPVVVHCSAGIGRTGCFIAVSIGTSQLMEEGGVDVLGIVCSMRRDRGGMVQTAEQYIFIHRALRDFEASLPALEPPARPAAN